MENNDYNHYNSDDCPKSFDKLDSSFISVKTIKKLKF